MEWRWDSAGAVWVEVGDSGVLAFDDSTEPLEVVEEGAIKRGTLPWQLSAGDGVKYLGVYVGDAQQTLTSLNADNLIRANLMDAGGQMVTWANVSNTAWIWNRTKWAPIP